MVKFLKIIVLLLAIIAIFSSCNRYYRKLAERPILSFPLNLSYISEHYNVTFEIYEDGQLVFWTPENQFLKGNTSLEKISELREMLLDDSFREALKEALRTKGRKSKCWPSNEERILCIWHPSFRGGLACMQDEFGNFYHKTLRSYMPFEVSSEDLQIPGSPLPRFVTIVNDIGKAAFGNNFLSIELEALPKESNHALDQTGYSASSIADYY